MNKEIAKQVNALLKQLSENSKNITLATLRTIAKSGATELWLLEYKKTIIGMATLVLVTIPTVTFARIEDVVVDGQYRGKGLGEKISKKLILRARARGAVFIDLTSRPERVAANKLYQKLGFEKRNTNVYRLPLQEKNKRLL